MNIFTNAKSLRLMAAAGVVAFYCGAAPAFASIDFQGENDPASNGPIANTHTGKYVLSASEILNAIGGNVTQSNKVGGEALRITGAYENNGTTNIFGGNATTNGSTTNSTGGVGMTVEGAFTNNGIANITGGAAVIDDPIVMTGGNGLNVHGDITNKGEMTVIGGISDILTQGYGLGTGGTGLYSAAGHFYNHGKLTVNGGEATADNSFAGAGIVVGAFSNYSHDVLAIGGNGKTVSKGDLDGVGGNAIEINGDFYNEGTIEGHGGNAKIGCSHHARGGDGLRAAGNIVNKGTLKGYGGIGDSTGSSYGGIATPGTGMRLSGLTENYGTIYAEGGSGPKTASSTATVEGGVGMIFDGGLINYSEAHITAIGGDGSNAATNGTGQGGHGATIKVKFENYGVISAKGGNAESTGGGAAKGGIGLLVDDGAYNYDTLIAQGGKKANSGLAAETPGVGIQFNDGLTNYKDAFLTLMGHGNTLLADGAAAVKLGGTPSTDPADDRLYGAWFKLGSYLALGDDDTNPGAYIDANGLDVVFENADPSKPQAIVISLEASTKVVGGTVSHSKFITNTSSNWNTGAANDIAIDSYTGPVMDVTITQDTNGGNFDYNFSAERIDWSSNHTSGNASNMLKALENDLVGKDIDASNVEWANILSSVDFQPDEESLRNRANELFGATMPVATTQAMQSMVRSVRFIDEMFSRNIQSLAKCRQTKACYYETNYDNRKAGLVCGVSNEPLMIWAQPFYFDGTQKGKRSWFHDFDENYYGITTGVAYDADFAILSAELHYYQGDLETRNYKGDVDAFGFELGIGRAFNIAENFTPWVEIRAGYTWMDLDQKRTDLNGDKAKSNPDAGVWTGGITVNNAFSITKQLKITPKIGVDFMHMNMDSYVEKGSALADRVKPDDYTSVQGTIGVQLDYNPTDDFYLEARANYHYEFADKSASVRAGAASLSSSLKVPGDDMSRSSASLGAGIGVKLTDSVSLQADYDVHLGDHYVGHQVSATLSFTF